VTGSKTLNDFQITGGMFFDLAANVKNGGLGSPS